MSVVLQEAFMLLKASLFRRIGLADVGETCNREVRDDDELAWRIWIGRSALVHIDLRYAYFLRIDGFIVTTYREFLVSAWYSKAVGLEVLERDGRYNASQRDGRVYDKIGLGRIE